MSVREMIRFFHRFDPDAYLSILQNEQGATSHPSQPHAYMLDELPFYAPRETDEYVYVLSFNHAPLSDLLVEALIGHPELVPDEVLIFWTIEQELLLETSMGEVRGKIMEVDAEEQARKCERSTVTSVFVSMDEDTDPQSH